MRVKVKVKVSLGISTGRELLLPRTPGFRVEGRPHADHGEDPISTALESESGPLPNS
jgi:hypothetical protein